MCALFGWLDYDGKVPYKVLKKITRHPANAAQERGTDASGISYVQDKNIVIYKKPKPAKKLKIDFPKNTRAAMGHTRLTTQGSAKLNYNNHPFYGKADKSFAFAHNGVIYNDVQLRMLHNLPETKIETDSYVAVQLIEAQKILNSGTLKNVAEEVFGSFVFTLLDEDNKLYIVKGSNPIHLIRLDRLGIYVYASTSSIVEKALKRCGLHNEEHTIIKVDEGEIITIDNRGKLTRNNFYPNIYSSLSAYSYLDDSCIYDDFYTDEKDLLLNICGCFGVDKEEVSLLFEYGYTAEDVEDLLIDTDSFNKAVNEIKYAETSGIFL
ncbi:MAG: class II glutamine amidotransferase [Clostridia bacterium]|nr:class II glutamine amidotransferase [Clostridia bacterium]